MFFASVSVSSGSEMDSPLLWNRCFDVTGFRIYASRAGASPTWKEHSSDSSTLIIAPALSNSPQ